MLLKALEHVAPRNLALVGAGFAVVGTSFASTFADSLTDTGGTVVSDTYTGVGVYVLHSATIQTIGTAMANASTSVIGIFGTILPELIPVIATVFALGLIRSYLNKI